MKRVETIELWMPLIQQGMALILEGDDARLAVLRNQLASASIKSLEVSGAGFFAGFEWAVSPEALAGVSRAAIGNVSIQTPDLEHGGGLILFLKDGRLDALEGYTFGASEWSEPLSSFTLSLFPGDQEQTLKALES